MAKKTPKVGKYNQADCDAAMKKNSKYQYKDQTGVVYTMTPKNYRSLDKSIFTEVTSVEVDSFDLDVFIATAYSLPEEFCCSWEASNDSSHQVQVSGVTPSEYDAKALEKMLKQGGCNISQTYIVLNDLCHKKLIKPGNYLVSVSW